VAFGSVGGAAVRRPGTNIGLGNEALRAKPPQPRPYAPAAARPSVCPEIDCVRHILSRPITAAAEHRAQSLGVGAERVLICADAITEEAYLTALANSLGTSYERFDRIAREDCPLDDDALIAAAAAGLLPIRQGGEGLLSFVTTFLMVALDEGKGVCAYARAVGVHRAAMSRYLRDIGERARNGGPGLGLVTVKPHPRYPHRRRVLLTAKGRLVASQIFRMQGQQRFERDDAALAGRSGVNQASAAFAGRPAAHR
jgi:hypothetical protein